MLAFILSPLLIVGAVLLSYVILVGYPLLLPPGADPQIARFGYLLSPLVPAFLLTMLTRPSAGKPIYKWLGPVAISAILIIVGWTLWREYDRLSPYLARGYKPDQLARFVDAFAVAGAAVAFFFAVLLFRSRFARFFRTRRGSDLPKRSKVALHGDADWMPMDKAAKIFPDADGIVIGERYRPDTGPTAKLTFEPGNKDTWGRGGKSPLLTFSGSFGSGHGIVFTGSGYFKTTGVVIPTCIKWPGSMVLLDPSTEVYPLLKKHRISLGHSVHIIDPDHAPEGFNVLNWVTKHGDPAENIATVVGWITAERPQSSSGGNEFFRTASRQLLTALLADIVLNERPTNSPPTLAELRAAIAVPETMLRKRLERIVSNSTSNFARQTAAPFVDMVKETFSGVAANASKDTEWLSYERYAALVSANGFDAADLSTGKIDVFVNIDLKTLNTHAGLGRVVIGALMNSVYDAGKHVIAGGGRVSRQTLFLLDEAVTLGRMSLLETARDEGRKYGLTLLMVYQSVGQLVDIWGRDARSKWLESTSFVSYCAVRDNTLARELSEMCGTFTAAIKNKSRSTGGGGTGRSTTSTQLQRRALIEPHEILQDMRTDEQIVFTAGQPPLRCGRAIYFRRPEMLAVVTQDQRR